MYLLRYSLYSSIIDVLGQGVAWCFYKYSNVQDINERKFMVTNSPELQCST